MIGIYKITSPTGNVYIGQSRNLSIRKRQYDTGQTQNQPALHLSVLKHGWNSHTFEVVVELPEDINQEVLDLYEVFYWQQYKSCKAKMLNIREPGEGGSPSEETRRKISETKKGMVGIKGMLNKNHSEETRRKIADKKRGNTFFSEEARKRMSEAAKNRKK